MRNLPMTTKIYSVFLLTSVFVSVDCNPVMVSAQTSPVMINSQDTTSIENITDFVESKDPHGFQNLELEETSEGLESSQNQLDIHYNLESKEIKMSNEVKGDLELEVATVKDIDSVDVVDDKIVYSGTQSKADIIVESVDGGLRQIIYIKSSDAPDFYDFPMEFDNGEKITIHSDGSASVHKADGSTKVVILKPWAKDANNQELKTWYEVVDNSTLRQRIDFTNAVFPVVADPTWCGNVTSRVEWKYEQVYKSKYNWSLNVEPTWCARTIAATSPTGVALLSPNNRVANSAWEEVYNKTPQHQAWDKKRNTSTYWSMYDQYVCHLFNVATATKDVWRLDPWRPHVGWPAIYFARCNPES